MVRLADVDSELKSRQKKGLEWPEGSEEEASEAGKGPSVSPRRLLSVLGAAATAGARVQEWVGAWAQAAGPWACSSSSLANARSWRSWSFSGRNWAIERMSASPTGRGARGSIRSVDVSQGG